MIVAKTLYGTVGAFTILFSIIAALFHSNSVHAVNKMIEGVKYNVNNVFIAKAICGTVFTSKLSFLNLTSIICVVNGIIKARKCNTILNTDHFMMSLIKSLSTK